MLTALPFEYIKHMDPGDRIRRSRVRPTGSRVRRGMTAETGV